MKEYALTMMKPAFSIALVLHDIMVNDVIPIDVIFMNVKMAGHVLQPCKTDPQDWIFFRLQSYSSFSFAFGSF